MGIKVIVGVLLVVALIVVGVVAYLSRQVTPGGKPVIGKGSPAGDGASKPTGDGQTAGDYIAGALGVGVEG